MLSPKVKEIKGLFISWKMDLLNATQLLAALKEALK